MAFWILLLPIAILSIFYFLNQQYYFVWYYVVIFNQHLVQSLLQNQLNSNIIFNDYFQDLKSFQEFLFHLNFVIHYYDYFIFFRFQVILIYYLHLLIYNLLLMILIIVMFHIHNDTFYDCKLYSQIQLIKIQNNIHYLIQVILVFFIDLYFYNKNHIYFQIYHLIFTNILLA